MSAATLHPVRRTNGPELVQAHLESRDHHGPWVQPFTTLDAFHSWYGKQVTGANASFIAREGTSDRIVGVTTLSQIFLKGFQSAYLSYYGMVAFAGRGLMTTAVCLTIDQAFNNIGLHRLEANIQPGNHRSIASAYSPHSHLGQHDQRRPEIPYTVLGGICLSGAGYRAHDPRHQPTR
jgi:ribosomal-protein-alanine N-acetyltransferase